MSKFESFVNFQFWKQLFESKYFLNIQVWKYLVNASFWDLKGKFFV